MNQCIKVVAITWTLSVAVCSPLPQSVEIIPSITSTIVDSSTVDPDTIQFTTAFPQLSGQTVAIFRGGREVTLGSNNSSEPQKDANQGTDLPTTSSEENSAEDDDKSRSQRNLAETKGAGQNETQSTTENSEEDDAEVKKSPITSHDHSTDIYGKTTAEELGDLSVIDVLLRRRRALSNSQKRKRSLPETAGSDEVVIEEPGERDEDVSEEIRTTGGSESPNVGRKDNLNPEVEVTEHAHTLNKNGAHVTSYSNSNNAQNEPANKKSVVNNEDEGKSTGSVDSAHQSDENLNNPTVLIVTVFRQHETDKITTPSAPGRQDDGNAKPSDTSSESLVTNASHQQTDNKSDLLEKHVSESEQESDTESVQKSEKEDTANENEKPLFTIIGHSISNVPLHSQVEKNGASLKRNTETQPEDETDLISSTDSTITTEKDKQLEDKENRHLFTNVTRYTKVETNIALLNANDKSKEGIKNDPSSQEHESHVADEGVKLLDDTTHSLFSNVSGHEHENNSEKLHEGNDALTTSTYLFSNVTARKPNYLEITEGTSQVATNVNATHRQEVSGRKLAVEISERTSQVSTNHEILHAVHRRSDGRIEVSNPTVVPKPNLASNLHLSTNPYDDDKPHDVINLHQESHSSEGRMKDNVCSDENHCNAKRSDDDEDVTSPVPHSSHFFTAESNVTSNINTPVSLQSQVQTTSNRTGESKSATDKNHEVEKRSRDDGDIREAGKSSSSVQTVDVSWTENRTKETSVTPTTYQTSTVSEATSHKPYDYSSTVISKSLDNERSYEGTAHFSVAESSQTASYETSSTNGDQNVHRSSDENEDENNSDIHAHAISTKEGSQDVQRNNEALHGSADEQKTTTSVGSVSTEHYEESTTAVAEKQAVLSSTTVRQETSTAEKSEIVDGFKSFAKFIGF